jgi:preprotein translocase SecE subunit
MLIFSYLVEDLWSLAWSRYPQALMRPQGLYANMIGVVLGLGLGIWGWRKDKYFKFVCEVATEVSQVVWPTRAEVRAATMVVVVITLICSTILFGMDQVWSLATDYLYGL